MRCRIQMTTLAVARVIQREQHLGGEFAALLQHVVDGVCVDLGVLRQLLQFALDLQQFVQHELHVT